MACVKRQLVFSRNVDLASENAFSECAARVISQYLRDAAEFVDKASHPSIRCPSHRATRFHTSKNRIRQVLMRTGGMQEPAVICYIDEQIRAGIRLRREHKSSREFAYG